MIIISEYERIYNKKLIVICGLVLVFFVIRVKLEFFLFVVRRNFRFFVI